MYVERDNAACVNNFVVGSHPNLISGEPRQHPRDLFKDLKTLQELSTLREEASIHLKDLKNLTAMSECNEREIEEQQLQVTAKEKEILKAVQEISTERRELCEGEDKEYSQILDREIAEMESVSSPLGKVAAKGKLLFSSTRLTKNLKFGKVVANAIKFDSSLLTEEYSMDIVEECPTSGSTIGMLSQEGELLLPERLGNIQSEKFKLVEGEKKAAKEMEVALGEQMRFTTRHLNHLRKFGEELVSSVSKVTEALVDLTIKCEDPVLINLFAENLVFKELQLKVVNEVMKLTEMDGKIKTKLIELKYHRNLFEPRLKLFNEVKYLTVKRQSFRSTRWTEENTPDSHRGNWTDSSAECSFSVGNPAGLDPF